MLCKPSTSLSLSLRPACLSCCLTASFYPHAGERKGEKRGRGEKQHLIRSSYSTSFKGTLNDVFLGRRQLHITSHAQGTTESCLCTGCGYSCARDGLVVPVGGERERRTRRGGLLPVPFLCGGGRNGKRGAVGLRHLSLAGRWWRRCVCGGEGGVVQEERESLP